jgi:hypothetical protein
MNLKQTHNIREKSTINRFISYTPSNKTIDIITALSLPNYSKNTISDVINLSEQSKTIPCQWPNYIDSSANCLRQDKLKTIYPIDLSDIPIYNRMSLRLKSLDFSPYSKIKKIQKEIFNKSISNLSYTSSLNSYDSSANCQRHNNSRNIDYMEQNTAFNTGIRKAKSLLNAKSQSWSSFSLSNFSDKSFSGGNVSDTCGSVFIFDLPNENKQNLIKTENTEDYGFFLDFF